MKSIVTALSLFCVLFGHQFAIGQEASQIPELKVLDRLIGTWDWKVTAKKSEWTPEDATTSGTLTREWVLNRRFIHETSGTADQPTICMWSYDPVKQSYRLWHFGIAGQSDHFGSWNEAAKTMTWKCDMGNGITAVGTSVFTDQDTDEWKMLAKDKDGKVYLDLEGKNKRKNVEPTKPDPRTEIATMIPYAITLLEAKKYELFVREIMNPDSAKKMEKDFAKDGGFANGAALWGKDLGPFTLTLFKEFKEQKPEMNEDETRAVFKSKFIKFDGKVSFRKFGKFWHLED